jgi:hypothetical protein
MGTPKLPKQTLGVEIELGSRVDRLPEPPVIVATSLEAARQLLGDPTLRWQSGRAALLDLGLRQQRGDPFIVAGSCPVSRRCHSPGRAQSPVAAACAPGAAWRVPPSAPATAGSAQWAYDGAGTSGSAQAVTASTTTVA